MYNSENKHLPRKTGCKTHRNTVHECIRQKKNILKHIKHIYEHLREHLQKHNVYITNKP
ncbi:hypothetical protein Hanom_Chr09g00799791 [Helianthus anomalus]